jgi:hypothetical protein
METGRAQFIADGAAQFAAERGGVRTRGYAVAPPTGAQRPRGEGVQKSRASCHELLTEQLQNEPATSRHWRASVLEFASALAPWYTHDIQSGRGLPHSKTWRMKLRSM